MKHTSRKIFAKKLRAASVEEQSITLVTGHASENSLYDYDEGNDSEQQLLACLHNQQLLAIFPGVPEIWSFPATSSTCEKENTNDHNFTTVKSHLT